MNCVNSNHRCAIAPGSQSHNDVMLVCSVLPESWFIGFVVQSSSLWYPLVSLGITDWAAMACSFLMPATPPSFHWEAHNSGINCSIPNSNSYVSQPPCCCPLQSPKPRGGYRNLLQPGLLTKIMLKLLLWVQILYIFTWDEVSWTCAAAHRARAPAPPLPKPLSLRPLGFA